MKSIFKHIVLFVFMLSVVHSAKAQTYEIPDTNFRNTLKFNYSNIFQGDLLITSEAKNILGSLDLQFKSIKNLDGIQFFESVYKIDASNNQLEYFPPIPNLTNLQNLILNYNSLTSLPSFEKNIALSNFQVYNNLLTELPSFGANTNMKQIYCNDNKIRTLGKIDSLSNLEILVAGSNPIEENPNYGKLKKLIELHVHNMAVDTIIGLDSLLNLKVLYAWGNRLNSIASIENNTTLELLNIGTNRLSSLPNLNNKPNLIFLNIDANFLSFEDLLPLNTSGLRSYFYAPQKKFSIDNQIKREKMNTFFGVSFDKNITENVYIWKKDGVTLDSSSTNTLQLNNITKDDAGIYSLKIINTNLPSLVLEFNEFSLTVDKCNELINLNYRIVSSDCKNNYTIDFENINIDGGQKPYKYVLSGVNYYLTSNDFYIQNVPSGKIKIKITDAKDCVVETEFELDKISNCDPVFSPNGDGVGDTYFIDEIGKVEVYNTQRQKVAQFDAPFVWNGTNSAGAFLEAGLYALIIEGEKVIYVTLVK